MRLKEIDRLKVLDQVIKGKLNKRAAGEQLKLSRRQIIRLCQRIKKAGSQGIIHGLRGKPSNRLLPAELIEQATELIRTKYSDFGPTLAAEKLAELDGIRLSTSTVRRAMIASQIWRSRKMKARHRYCRRRRACLGELVQVDGSQHDWFEGRASRCWLIVFIDDATSRILYGEFVDSENTSNLMRMTSNYLQQYGRPVAFYVDKDSIFRVNRQPTIEEQLLDAQPATQYSRAMAELNIDVICANTPQAKGRVERSFKTHQDRLVKELRLKNICDFESANRFLKQVYLPDCNARFGVKAQSDADAHRPLLKTQHLEQILCIRTERTVFNDYTVRFQNRFLQILPQPGVCVRPKDKVQIEVRLDGSLHMRFNGRYLKFEETAKPLPTAVQKNESTKPRKLPIPPKELVDRHRHFRLPRATWAEYHELRKQSRQKESSF